MVRGCDRLPGWEGLHKLRGSMKACQECMGPRAGKQEVCILLYDETMLSTPGPPRYTLVAQSTSVIPVSPCASFAGFPLAVVVRNRFSCPNAW